MLNNAMHITKPPIDKEIILNYLKRNTKKRFTKNYLTRELKKEMGDSYSITFNSIDKWVEVLLASNSIKFQYAGRIKLIWCD
jgi:hypothetical protein